MTLSILPTAIGEGVTGSQWLSAGITVAVAILIGAGGWWFIRRRSQTDHDSYNSVMILSRMLFGVILALGLYIGLRIIGYDPAPLLAGAGVLGITLAFALRDIAANYISGILMGLRKPFRLGDQIISGDHEGTVEDLNLRYTMIRTYEGVRVLLPNGKVLQNPLTNLTINGTRRTEVAVSVAYGTDLQKARQVLIDAVSALDEVAPDSETQAWVESLEASWVSIKVRYWHEPRIADMWRVRSAVVIAIVEALESADVQIPFEHTVVELANKQAPTGIDLS